MTTLLVRNGKIYYEGTLVEKDILVENGKIVKIFNRIGSLESFDEVIEASGKIVSPGFIDIHVHFRDPGFPEKEDFYSGSCAAAAGGVTTVLDMPNTNPKTNSLGAFKQKKKIGESKSLIDFTLSVGIPEDIHEILKMYNSGARIIKIYSYEHEDIVELLVDILDLIRENNLDVLIMIHAESKRIIDSMRKKLVSHRKDLSYHLKMRPPEAEYEEIRRILQIKNSGDIPLHFVHVSTGESIRILNKYKQRNYKLSFEVSPHHLLLDYESFKHLGPIIKANPPIRCRKDREALLDNINQVDVFASDHAPHTALEKLLGLFDIDLAPPGIAGIETMFPLLYTLYNKMELDLTSLFEKISTNPARILGLKSKGRIKEGFDADLVVLDPKKKWTIKGGNLHGKTKFTPFEGFEVIGKIEYTLVRGETVFYRDECVGKRGHGIFVGVEKNAEG